MDSRRARIVLLASLSLACSDAGGGDELGEGGSTGSTTTGADTSADTSGTSGESSESTSGESSESTSETTGEGTSETTGETGGPLDDLLTLEHVQVKGTHNSYHVEPMLPFDASHEYTMPPLDEQLELHGVRAFELDLHRNGDFLLVYHIQFIDPLSTCNQLSACLTTIADWSDAHPLHTPIMVWFEIKDSTGGEPIDDLLLVEQTILDAMPIDKLITPDLVRGDHASLRDALDSEGWPTLGEVRGKIMFMILNGDHPSVADYTFDSTSLDGRLMFVDVDDFTRPYAAVSKINDPASPTLADAHAAHIVTASNTCSAADDDAECIAALPAALAGGSHGLMDDFPAAVEGMRYFLDFADGNPARCNDATAPNECTAEAIEDLP
jgi:hypothetical protein